MKESEKPKSKPSSSSSRGADPSDEAIKAKKYSNATSISSDQFFGLYVDTRHLTRDTRHATRDTRHATRDTRHSFCAVSLQCPSFVFICLWCLLMWCLF